MTDAPHTLSSMLGRSHQRLRRVVSALVFLMLAANCQALMQGQAAVDDMAPVAVESSDASTAHDCCPLKSSLGDCERCLDEAALQGRSLAEPPFEAVVWLAFLITSDDFSLPALAEPRRFSALPISDSYPAIYLTQLRFLE